MADVNLQLVREFFELNVFRVLTNWQQEPWRDSTAEYTPQLFVENNTPRLGRELEFILHPMDIPALERAVVHVRAWHTDRFYPSVIESSPVLSMFEASESLAAARHVFEEKPFVTILVLSELPVGREQRERSAQLLKQAGVDHIIEFRHILSDLLERVSINGSYSASETLQTLRLLKRYKLIRNQQLEFAFPAERPAPPPSVASEDARSQEDILTANEEEQESDSE